MTRFIVLTCHDNPHYRHFVHYMEFLYWCTDIILDDDFHYVNCQGSCPPCVFHNTPVYVIVQPPTTPFRSDKRYTTSYLDKIAKLPFVVLSETSDLSTLCKSDEDTIQETHCYRREKEYTRMKGMTIPQFPVDLDNGDPALPGCHSYECLNWFPRNNSEKIRDLFLGNSDKNNGDESKAATEEEKKEEKNNDNGNIKIGLVNREVNRVLLNATELCEAIKHRFGLEVNVTCFEDKSFDYQIEFFNKHNIIISPHGAQLCSAPFAQDDSLIIECVHEEWHPYHYFPGLSYSSNKYHAMICDDHSVYPNVSSKKYIKCRQEKLDITVDIRKVTEIIGIYLKNNKLESRNPYLI